MALKFGTVSSSVDLEAAGKRAGTFDLSHSNNRYAFSSIRSPLGVVRGGDGPTVLVCGGNHGDEYEGQLIVRRLFNALDEKDLAGRLILAPALNMPAVLGMSRVSPLDGGNLNRSFPGEAYAEPTAEIAGFVATQLMPLADIALDLHSGGTATEYLDSAYFCTSSDRARNADTLELARVMGLEHTLVVPLADTAGDFDTSALEAGCEMLSCELGGQAQVSSRSLNAGWHGVLRILLYRGVIREASAVRLGLQPPNETRYLDLGVNSSTLTAQSHGLVEPLVGLGEPVSRDQVLALLHNIRDLGAPAQELVAGCDGLIAIRRANPMVEPGDHIFVVSPELSASQLSDLLSLQQENSICD